MKLDPSKVPAELRPLLIHAERWGLGDDYDRSTLVEASTASEREELVRSIGPSERDLYAWLAGSESASRNPSEEYVALTNLTLAVEYAKALRE